jgi:hypothetical protein
MGIMVPNDQNMFPAPQENRKCQLCCQKQNIYTLETCYSHWGPCCAVSMPIQVVKMLGIERTFTSCPNMAGGIRHADHVAASIRTSWQSLRFFTRDTREQNVMWTDCVFIEKPSQVHERRNSLCKWSFVTPLSIKWGLCLARFSCLCWEA